MSQPKELEDLMRFAFRGAHGREPSKRELEMNMDILEDELDRLDWEDAMEAHGMRPYVDADYPGRGWPATIMDLCKRKS